jgi:hypothetical protein
LAVPLLLINKEEYHEICFAESPLSHTWPEREIADLVATFAHFVYIDSGRTLIFSDLQGNVEFFFFYSWY